MQFETGTSLAMSVLGSGSAGNCSILDLQSDLGTRTILIDLGLSPRETASRLLACGRRLDSVEAACLTHLDQDHLNPGWAKGIDRWGFKVFMHRRHVKGAAAAGITVRRIEAFEDDFAISEQTSVRPIRLPHDDLGAVGYLFDHRGTRLGYATDLGRVTDDLLSAFVGVDLLSIESNYCPRMQMQSPRPAFLKQRIMGGMGHLSNEQSVAAVKQIAIHGRPQHIVLLHLSRQCNSPQRVREIWRQEAPELLDRVTISDQYRPTPWIRVKPLAPARSFAESLFESA